MNPVLRHLRVQSGEARTGHLCCLTNVMIKATKNTVRDKGRQASWKEDLKTTREGEDFIPNASLLILTTKG